MTVTLKLKPNKNFNRDDRLVIASTILITTGCIYYLANFPLLVAIGMVTSGIILAIAFLMTSSFALSTSALGISQKSWQIRPWFICSAILAIGFVLTQSLPAQAFLFDTAETAVTDIITAAGSNIDTAVITGIFTFFRIIVILAFIAGIIGMGYQAMQGGDWKPIFTSMGIGMGIVMAIEVLTNMVLG